jgi:putative ABC transport system substrate-binding protein
MDGLAQVIFSLGCGVEGANPPELSVEQPTKLELITNVKTAKQIGLTIPPNVLARAAKVIR